MELSEGCLDERERERGALEVRLVEWTSPLRSGLENGFTKVLTGTIGVLITRCEFFHGGAIKLIEE